MNENVDCVSRETFLWIFFCIHIMIDRNENCFSMDKFKRLVRYRGENYRGCESEGRRGKDDHGGESQCSSCGIQEKGAGGGLRPARECDKRIRYQ